MMGWADSDLHNSRRVGKLDLLGMWSYVDLSESVAESQNNGIKMGSHRRLESQSQDFAVIPVVALQLCFAHDSCEVA